MSKRISLADRVQIVLPLQAGDDLLAMHQLHPERYPFLLESVAHSADNRYAILMGFPQQSLTLQTPEQAEVFIADWQTAFSAESLSPSPTSLTDLPFRGGWFFYFSYDYAQVVELTLNLPHSTLPLAKMVRVPAGVVIDYEQQTVTLFAESAYADKLPQLEADWYEAQKQGLESSEIEVLGQTEEAPEKFLTGVETVKDYILAGDVFQVNLSRQWLASLAKNTRSEAIYQALRTHNPAPFAVLADFGDWSIISSSPERLTRIENRTDHVGLQQWVETRPIAGTRRRGQNEAKDLALIQELISHPKERAEHIMLIDLERNDLGRICQPGTVSVNELMTIESYEHVHHIVSNIQGQLQAGMTPLQVLHAVFPGGTITGCPKVRCMEIIAELEQMPREAYTGSVGYLNRDGTLDSNILIRSFVHHKADQNQLTFRAGAGIVADSIAEKELEETRHKARGLLRALGVQA